MSVTLHTNWTTALLRPRFKHELLISIAAFISVTYLFSLFLSWAEARQGRTLNDPLLAMFHPVNITWIIFVSTYLPVLIGLALLSRYPYLLLRFAQCYTLLLLLRMLTMYLLPLEPPAHIIPLHDPVLELTAYKGRLNLKDLFFSGHTATLFLFFLLLPLKKWKMVFLFCTFNLGTLVLLQHVHYTVDVLAAPAFAWLSVRSVRLLRVAVAS